MVLEKSIFKYVTLMIITDCSSIFWHFRVHWNYYTSCYVSNTLVEFAFEENK